MNLNKAIILGRLTREPETRMLPSGKPVCSFSLVTNRFWTNQEGNKQEETEYHNIVVFGKLADICSKYLNKGQLAMIEGRIQTRSWEDKKDGSKRYRTEIVADNMQMGPRAGRQSQVSQSPQTQSPQTPRETPQEKTPLTQEDIPVIDAEEPIKEDISQPESTSDQKEGVDLNNIPF